MNAHASTQADFVMSPWVEALAAKYGAIAIGLTAGTAAKYGLMMAEGRRVTLRTLAIDILLIGMTAIAASNICEKLGADGNTAAMLSALVAVSSDRVLRMLRERFLRRVDAELAADLTRRMGEIRQAAQMEASGANIVHDAIEGKLPDIPQPPRIL